MSTELKKITPNTMSVEVSFWDDADYRCHVWKKIRRLYEELLNDTQADSVQKRLACKRLTFISTQLESLEKRQIEQGGFNNVDTGQYIALCNSMSGLLRLLGLERQIKTQNLQAYLKQVKDGA